jgi:hypothetical protein
MEDQLTFWSGIKILLILQKIWWMKVLPETLWLATSKAGDYHHDNMNSEMFMMWVKHSLIPTFEKLNQRYG